MTTPRPRSTSCAGRSDSRSVSRSRRGRPDRTLRAHVCRRRSRQWSAAPAASGKAGQRSGVSPQSVDGRITQTLCVYLDEVDKHCEHARSAGARILDEPFTTDYGDDYWEDRSYRVLDTEGHHWWFVQRMREQNAG
ncbi:MAG: hypothetical protein R3E12_05120 [Candidatus Eisenbacteria bacterium]